MLFQWTPALAVGVKEIDDQHIELFARINKLLEALDRNSKTEVVLETIDFLEKYVEVHFGLEETYMDRFNYPAMDFNAHELQHTVFWENFAELKSGFAEHGPTKELGEQLQAQVCAWLINHISRVDTKLGAFLKDKLS